MHRIILSFQICDNHEVLATNQWCKPNAENELARAMLRRRPLMPNGNGSPKGQRNARSNHEVLATEREPEGQAQSAQQSVC